MSGVGRHEKHSRANLSTVKLMNLNDTLPVRPHTRVICLLTHTVGHSKLPENKACFMTMGSRSATQAPQGQGPNLRTCGLYRTSGLPKAGSSFAKTSYGNGSAIVTYTSTLTGASVNTQLTSEGQKDMSHKKEPYITEPRRNIFPASKSVGLADLYRTNASNSHHVNHKVIHLIADVNTLTLAYEMIKSKPGNMTPGLNLTIGTTLDGISRSYIENVSSKVKAGQFKFKPARRIYIPKPGKSSLRPLTIPSPREKIVQKAIQMVLEAIYEPSFKPSSHGFRPNRGTHSALKKIDQQCKQANWFIEADISKCFDRIDHKKLLTILNERISCTKTLSLIKSALKAGYATQGRSLAQVADIGTPQGSVLSPILCNIYMHKLDQYMEEIMQKHNTGKKRRRNPAYTKLANQLAKEKSITTRVKIRKQMKRMPSGDPMDPNLIRVRYVRYADDFIVSILGPYKLAAQVKLQIEQFLRKELKLELNQVKSVITNAKKKARKIPRYTNPDGEKHRETPSPKQFRTKGKANSPPEPPRANGRNIPQAKNARFYKT